ncbi:dihydrodipicolinate synthase family protein [Bosea sp. LjRoot9]|uniref:dihydrodipicolinate synthase family protein n=1 Tax=Bosea sp. LjRoot9 TaxID=3342341 RepID=UPI003ECCC3BC
MLASNDLRGIIPALPTPVRADIVDAKAVEALFSWLHKAGVDGVLPLGGTGEYGSLAKSQRIRMVELCAKEMAGKGPVISGILDPGFHDALQSGKDLAAAGADALLVLTPYYTNPTQAGVRDYFLRYADNSPVPILIYEIPYRTRVAIQPEILHELSRHPNIIGMKACNVDMFHFLQVVAGVAPDFAVLSGEDTLFPLQIAAGAVGGIVVLANFLPRVWRKIFDLASAGQLQEAILLHRELVPLINIAFAETNPGPIKSIADLIGVDAPDLLAPLVNADPKLSTRLRAEMSRLMAKFEQPVG